MEVSEKALCCDIDRLGRSRAPICIWDERHRGTCIAYVPAIELSLLCFPTGTKTTEESHFAIETMVLPKSMSSPFHAPFHLFKIFLNRYTAAA